MSDCQSPYQNRALADGSIVSQPWRGQMLGIRGGQFHDHEHKILGKRRWAGKRWICCQLQFKNRHRQVMGKGYTHLFFLDEVNALAAGHRPCFQCRFEAAKHFQHYFATAMKLWTEAQIQDHDLPGADMMDRVLHGQRWASARKKSSLTVSRSQMIDGVVVTDGDRNGSFLTICDGQWYRINRGRYQQVSAPKMNNLLAVTPPITIEVLRLGYRPQWHTSICHSQPV